VGVGAGVGVRVGAGVVWFYLRVCVCEHMCNCGRKGGTKL